MPVYGTASRPARVRSRSRRKSYWGIVHVEGLPEFRRALADVDKGLDRALSKELRVMARGVRDEARSLTPVRSGELRKSVKHSVTKRRVAVYSRLPYAPVVEWGGTIKPKGAAIRFERVQMLGKAAYRRRDEVVKRLGVTFNELKRRGGFK